ncbi:MAG TPA: molybdenum cofactor biosynthesis protein MoaE [Cytophagaceae bacterium]|jgi:molybdopterin synthase catalytic subunit|nr:molybdenum cofactor biosynthesis protein MoaE [Cytophagaceae bacterium]
MTASALFHHPAAVDLKLVVAEPIDVCGLLQRAHHPKAGGIVLFSGEVRNHHEQKKVTHLEYEAFVPMAEKIIQEIIQTAIEKWNLHNAICVHRIGKLEICESAVVVITAHSHRKESYEANRYIIDRVKHEAPIWKKEFYEDGTSSWGGDCHCG